MLKVKIPATLSESSNGSSSSSSAVIPSQPQKEKKSLTEQLIHSLEIDGKPIVKLRLKDGYGSLTFMCKAGGKQTNHYMENKKTKAFIEKLSSVIRMTDLIEKNNGGKDQETWVHPRILINAAQWVSVDFDLAVSELVQKFMGGQLTTEESQETGRALFVGDVFKTPERLAARAKDKTARKTMRELIKIKLIRPGSSDYAIPANIVNVFAMDLPTSTKKFMKSMKLKGPAANYQSIQQLSCATWINDCLYEWLMEQLDESVTRKKLIDQANFYGNIIAPVGRQSRKLIEY
jgi:hypothetical protein